MDGGGGGGSNSGEDGKQEKHLVLAHKLFLLSHPDVDDLSKVDLRADVLSAVKSDDMAALFESLAATGVLEPDASLHAEMRARIDEEIRKLDEKIADAEENLGESEVREAHLAKSLYFVRVGEKEKALEQLKVTEGKTVAIGQKMDLVFHTLQIGLFYMDFDLISKSIDKAKKLFEEGGDWERKNRLKVYEGLYCMATRDFKKATSLFLDSISTFTTYELFPYDTFIFYTVLMSIISLDGVSLKQKVVDAPEILAVIGKVPHLSEFLNSLYNCQYKSFFVAFSGLTEQIKLDRYLQPHFCYYMREVRTVVYSQFLESDKSVTMEAMASAFGVTVDFIDQERSFMEGDAVSEMKPQPSYKEVREDLQPQIDVLAGLDLDRQPQIKARLQLPAVVRGGMLSLSGPAPAVGPACSARKTFVRGQHTWHLDPHYKAIYKATAHVFRKSLTKRGRRVGQLAPVVEPSLNGTPHHLENVQGCRAGDP